jgi:hypothetical protein
MVSVAARLPEEDADEFAGLRAVAKWLTHSPRNDTVTSSAIDHVGVILVDISFRALSDDPHSSDRSTLLTTLYVGCKYAEPTCEFSLKAIPRQVREGAR